jgi:oxygen-dependent protoporphyrinogen oxidase
MVFAPKPGKQGLFTLRRGMQTLIDALGQKLQRHCRLNEPVLSLARAKDKWRVRTPQTTYEADVVFAALPAPQMASLLPDMPAIECLSLDLVHLGFSSLKHPFPGYGYLVPSTEQESLMGMIFDSEVFPHQREGAKFTAIVRPGGASKEIALRALSSHLHIDTPPDWIEMNHAKEAIPQYRLGHLEKMRAAEQKLSNLYLLGNYIDGSSVDHCIGRSTRMVKHFF